MARVLLLTPPEQAVDLTFLLEDEGHQPCFWPILGARPRVEPGLRASAEQAHRLTWGVALSRPALLAFYEAVNGAGTRAALRKMQWLCADASIASTVERQGGTARIPGDGKWTSAVAGLLTADDEVLVLHERPVPEILIDSLHSAGVSFTPVAVELPPAVPLGVVDHSVVIVHSAAAGQAWVEAASEAASPQVDDGEGSCCALSLRSGERSAGGGVRGNRVPPNVPPTFQDTVPLLQLSPTVRPRIVASTAAVAAVLQAGGVEVYATATDCSADAVMDAALKALSQ